MQGDGECTASPDSVFGHSLTACCVEHDQTAFTVADDWALAECIIGLASDPFSYVILAVTGAVYFLGLRLFGPLYRRFRRRR